jgi:hypothetical protein
MSLSRSLQYLFLAIIVTTVGFSLYQWNQSRASTQKTAPNNGLVGYWSFDEGTGTLAGDASGNGNTGTLTNGPTWTTGKLGKAINFDGVDDYVNISSPSLGNTYTFSAWVRVSTYAGAPIQFPIFGEYTGSGDTKNYLYIDTVGRKLGLDQYLPSSGMAISSTTINAGVWYFVVATQTAPNQRNLYVNGVLEATANEVYSGGAPTIWTIGKRADSSAYYFNGQLDEVRIYNRALSGTEITNLYNLGAEKLNVSPVSNLTSGLVGYWTFDGKDTPWTSSSAGTATDRSGNGNTGTLTNMSRATSPVSGKLGQALNFDGVDDYASTPLDLTSSSFTLSAWVKSTNTANNGDRRTFLSKRGAGDEWILYQDLGVNQTIRFTGWDSGGAGTKGVGGTTNFVANQWYYVVLTYDGTTTNMFINGVLEGTTSAGNPIRDTVNTVVIGKENLRPWSGSLDEVRIYNRALSATEVQSLYDLGASDKVNSSVSQNQGTGRLDSGLAGYWKLDDASGTTATDSSVNANNGTLTNGPTWGTGHIGGDVVFDGVDDYVDAGAFTDLTGNFTVSTWMYITGTTGVVQDLVSKFGGTAATTNFLMEVNSGGTSVSFFVGDGNPGNAASATVSLGQWYFVTGIWDGTNTKIYLNGSFIANATTPLTPDVSGTHLFIGSRSSSFRFTKGSIDEVRVYNRALSADEVSQLYRLTTPTGVDTSLKGYWSFDGSATNWTSSSAGTVADLSGSGNTGTLTNMNRATSSVSGKLGQALKFDGTNYVSTSGSLLTGFGTADLSFSTWVKTTGYVNYGSNRNAIIARDTLAVDGYGYGIGFYSTNLPVCFVGADGLTSGGSALNDNNWHFLMLVRRSNVVECWEDGVKLTDSASTSNIGHTAPMYFGNDGQGNRQLNGKIDEVRLYNRALSATEITALYNSGR